MRANPSIADWWLVMWKAYNALLDEAEENSHLFNGKDPMFFTCDGEFLIGATEVEPYIYAEET